MAIETVGTDALRNVDPDVWAIVERDRERHNETLNFIASENYASPAVLECLASHLNVKYAEGYPGARYYQGVGLVDDIERLAVDRAKQLFGAEHANVQPYSGSPANMAAYFSVLQPGDTLLGMELSTGGHLTHGAPVSFSSRLFNAVQYGVDPTTELIDYDQVEALALRHKPKLIVAGTSAYARIIDWARFREIADTVERPLHGGYRPHRRPGRGRRPSQSGAVRGPGHDHHAQEPARPARRAHPVEGRAGEGRRPGRLPAPAGRSAPVGDRGEGGLLQGGDAARLPHLPGAGRGECPRPRRRRSKRAGCRWSAAAPTRTCWSSSCSIATCPGVPWREPWSRSASSPACRRYRVRRAGRP